MFPGETVISGATHPGTAPTILQSPAGYYVGFLDTDGLPYSRETIYLESLREAEAALQHVTIITELHGEVPNSPFVRR